MEIAIIIVAILAVIGGAVWYGFHSGRFAFVQKDQDIIEDDYKNDDNEGGGLPNLDDIKLYEEGDQSAQNGDAKDEFDLSGNVFISDEEYEKESSQSPSPDKSQSEKEEIDIFYDKLCSFKTGRAFYAGCQKALSESGENGNVWAVLYFDYKRFRYLNSLRGISVGDHAITYMSNEISNIFPPGSMITRVSADHFMAAVPFSGDSKDEFVESFSQQLRRVASRVNEDMAIRNGVDVPLGAAFTNTSSDYDAMLLMHRANVARFCARMSRELKWSIFDESMLRSGLFGDSAMADYKENQYMDDISIYYQPMADLVKGTLAAGDVLVRWTCEEESYKDIPLTTENGRLPTNNRRVVYQALKLAGHWIRAGKSVPINFLQLTVLDFYLPDIDHFLLKCMQDFQITAASLVIQVDHSVVRLCQSTAINQLKKIKDIGVKTAVFGIDRSYQDLNTLEGLPFDYVVFHRSVSDGIEKRQERVAHMQSLISAASKLGLITVFCGVNNQGQAAIIKKHGGAMVHGRSAGACTNAESYGRSLGEYVARYTTQVGGTTILQDSALSGGEFDVY